MPTFIPGTNAVVTLDNTSGTPQDVSTTVSTLTYDMTSPVGTFYTFGTNVANKTEGKRTYNGTIGVRSAEDTTSADYILSAWGHPGAGNVMGTKTLTVQSPDATSASYQYAGEIRASAIQFLNQDAGGDGTPATKNFAFEWDSEPTRTIIT